MSSPISTTGVTANCAATGRPFPFKSGLLLPRNGCFQELITAEFCMISAYQNSYSGHLNVFSSFVCLEYILTCNFMLKVLPELGISESPSEIEKIIVHCLV